MDRLFAYGTLMCPEVMAEVSGVRLPSEPARLDGYRRGRVRGADYPAITADPAGRVEGVVYRGVRRFSWIRLDQFEGRPYRRDAVRVELADGSTLTAAAYVLRDEFLPRLDAKDWDYEAFLRGRKGRIGSR